MTVLRPDIHHPSCNSRGPSSVLPRIDKVKEIGIYSCILSLFFFFCFSFLHVLLKATWGNGEERGLRGGYRWQMAAKERARDDGPSRSGNASLGQHSRTKNGKKDAKGTAQRRIIRCGGGLEIRVSCHPSSLKLVSLFAQPAQPPKGSPCVKRCGAKTKLPHSHFAVHHHQCRRPNASCMTACFSYTIFVQGQVGEVLLGGSRLLDRHRGDRSRHVIDIRIVVDQTPKPQDLSLPSGPACPYHTVRQTTTAAM